LLHPQIEKISAEIIIAANNLLFIFAPPKAFLRCTCHYIHAHTISNTDNNSIKWHCYQVVTGGGDQGKRKNLP
jgi:hypothetical protein